MQFPFILFVTSAAEQRARLTSQPRPSWTFFRSLLVTTRKMHFTLLPREILLEIAELLLFADYSSFRTYLALRQTNKQLRDLIGFPRFEQLSPHVAIFRVEGLLPCKICEKIRPTSHFFGGYRVDGIGTASLRKIQRSSFVTSIQADTIR